MAQLGGASSQTGRVAGGFPAGAHAWVVGWSLVGARAGGPLIGVSLLNWWFSLSLPLTLTWVRIKQNFKKKLWEENHYCSRFTELNSCFFKKNRLTEWVLSSRIEVGYAVSLSPVRQTGMSYLKHHWICFHATCSSFLRRFEEHCLPLLLK